jgi:hypothetical protein
MARPVITTPEDSESLPKCTRYKQVTIRRIASRFIRFWSYEFKGCLYTPFV